MPHFGSFQDGNLGYSPGRRNRKGISALSHVVSSWKHHLRARSFILKDLKMQEQRTVQRRNKLRLSHRARGTRCVPNLATFIIFSMLLNLVFGFNPSVLFRLSPISDTRSLTMLFGQRKSDPSSAALAPREIIIGGSEDRMDMRRTADFLTYAMYDEMPRNQRKELLELEAKDLTNRYTEKVGARLPTTLILAKEDKEIVGSIGLDCQVRHKTLECFRDIRNTESLVDFLDRDCKEEICVVLANLAVRRDRRGEGLARNLLAFAEEQTRVWGYNDLYLLVDSTNVPAQNLYKSSGFKEIFRDSTATCVVSGPSQLQTEECVKICYRKRVAAGGVERGSNGGLFGLFGK